MLFSLLDARKLSLPDRASPPTKLAPTAIHACRAPHQASPLPSLQTILDLPAFRSAELICGSIHLDEPVTWVAIAEIMDVWRFLSGGEMLLSTGMELTRVSPPARRAYLHGLAKAGVRALGLELVQWVREVPSEILDAARILQFPIFVFREEISFSDLTRAAHQEILRPKGAHDGESTIDTLLNSLVETGRDQAFLDRQLGPILSLPQRPRATLIATLEAAAGCSLQYRRGCQKARRAAPEHLLPPGTAHRPSRIAGCALHQTWPAGRVRASPPQRHQLQDDVANHSLRSGHF